MDLERILVEQNLNQVLGDLFWSGSGLASASSISSIARGWPTSRTPAPSSAASNAGFAVFSLLSCSRRSERSAEATGPGHWDDDLDG